LVGDSLGSLRGVTISSGSLATSVHCGAWRPDETSGGLSNLTPRIVYLIGRNYAPSFETTQEPYIHTDDNPVKHSLASGDDGYRRGVVQSMSEMF